MLSIAPTPTATPTPPHSVSIVSVDDLTVRFGDHTALDHLSLSIAEGGVHGLLGPNGSGKTTLVRVLSTLLRPTAGRVRVAGHDLADNPVAVRQSIGLAGQSAAVDDLLTGRENLEIVGRLYGLDRPTARERAGDVLERLSLADAGDKLVGTYSGGMRRRLDLGASLTGRPRLLLLDEPTTGLDPRTRLELWDFLRDLVAGGTSVLPTTQYLEEADALAERITVIDSGTVIAAGTASDLKLSIGTSHLVVAPNDPAHLSRTVDALGPVFDTPLRIDSDRRAVIAVDRNSVDDLVAAANALRHADIDLSDIGIERPSLDDVFLTITGRPPDPVPPESTHESSIPPTARTNP